MRGVGHMIAVPVERGENIVSEGCGTLSSGEQQTLLVAEPSLCPLKSF